MEKEGHMHPTKIVWVINRAIVVLALTMFNFYMNNSWPTLEERQNE